MAYPYITKADLEARLSASVVRQILDDDADGNADTDPVDRVCKESSSKVAGYLRGMYDLDVVASNPPEEVIRLALDVATAYLAQRHPEYVRRDWVDLMKQADRDLANLRAGKTRLDVEGAPEPAANRGSTVLVGDPDEFDEDTYEPTFAWGSSDF